MSLLTGLYCTAPDINRWAPKSTGGFLGAWFAIFFLSMFFRFLLWIRVYYEKTCACSYYRRANHPSEVKKSSSSIEPAQRCAAQPPPFLLQVEVPRMLLIFTTVVLGYALMLIAMTYVVVM